MAVLAKAGETFWKLGYEGASIVDLTRAMGITPQSLYAAFGSKAELYREALDWYGSAFATLTPDMLARPGALATLETWLETQAELFSDPDHPPGCMISTAVLGCAVEHEPVARVAAARREATIGHIRARLVRARAEGEMRPDADPGTLARFVGAIIQGMSIQARDGARRAELVALARLAGAELRRQEAPAPAAEPAARAAGGPPGSSRSDD